jgi:glyoxylase-like metal-dependent hydrolase (beta-lactamase superfamily II)
MDHDDYSGHVEPGGPTISRTVDVGGTAVEIRKLSVGDMDNNVYLLRDVAADRALLIDAADDAERILAEIGDTTVDAIFTTHGHWDHHRALEEVARATGATVVHHPADNDMAPRTPDVAAGDGGTLSFGEVSVELIHTPGHTPGSTCLLLAEHHLFTGDTLFPGGPGNTFGDATAFRTIMRSLRERVFTLDDETWVYPGHGDDTTLGAERPSLDDWESRGW